MCRRNKLDITDTDEHIPECYSFLSCYFLCRKLNIQMDIGDLNRQITLQVKGKAAFGRFYHL